MNENDLEDDLRISLKADKNILENLKIDNQYEVPDWEDKFINTIEKMNTIPYVLLGHFQFLTINCIDESLNENESKEAEVDQIETKQQQPINHWDLVKRMIFSKVIASSSHFKLKQITNTLKTNQLNNLIRSKKLVSPTNNYYYSQKLKDQFSDVYNQFVDLIKIKKEKSKKKLSRKSRNEKIKLKNSKSVSKEFENLNIEELNKKSLDKRQISKKKITEKGNDGLIDLDDIVRKKKLYKLSLIMGKDDGPFLTDYRFLLGIEFWSNFCNIDKYQLMSICSNNYWLDELKSFTSGKLMDLRKDGYSKEANKNRREFSYLKELKQFLKGTDKPQKAPQRIISSEEKFRLIPYPKLFNPNTDLKKTFHFHTMQDQLNKKIKKMYVSIVNLIGGKYPLKRTVGYEEAYEDNLLWVLDTYQAKTRFMNIINDQINKPIN